MYIRDRLDTRGAGSASGYVPGAARRVEFSMNAGNLLDEVSHAADRDQVSPMAALAVDAKGRSLRAVKDASGLAEGERLLPLRLGALRRAMEQIAKGDSWLLVHDPVMYFDADQKVHIDFVNLAGFCIDGDGRIFWRSVNPF